MSDNTATLAGGSVYAFILPLMTFSVETMQEASLLDNNFVLLEEGIAGLTQLTPGGENFSTSVCASFQPVLAHWVG